MCGAVILVTASAWSLRLSWTGAAGEADWAAWIRLGGLAEGGGDLNRAAYCYRRAAEANRQFQPSWTLANYYFRREDWQGFAVWATRALRMAHGDARPVFELCWRADPHPELVLRATSERRDILRQYLAYLTAEGRLDAAGEAARRLLPEAQADDVPELLAYTGRRLETGGGTDAVEVWNALCRRGAIPYRPLAPENGVSLSNGDFDAPLLSLGLDWRIVPWTGVAIIEMPHAAGLRLTLSGTQPESCELLTQFVPVASSRSYRLRYELRGPGLKDTGIHWRVYRASDSVDLAQAAPELSSEEWSQQELRFSTGSHCELVRLALVYQRPAGAPQTEGSLWLRHVKLD